MTRRGGAEGSIYQRGDGRWTASISLGYAAGKRQRKYIYGKTRRDVAEQLTKGLRDTQQGLPVGHARTTVEQFLDHWLEESARPTLRPLTYVTYRGLVRHHLVPALGHVRLDRLTPAQVQTMLNSLSGAGLAPATVRNALRVLHRALEIATRWGLVARNVASLVDGPRMTRDEVVPLSPEEARRLLDAVKGDRLEALYAVALACGLRQGEILGLRWAAVDLEVGTMRVMSALALIDGEYRLVEPKSATSRRGLTLPAIAVEALRRHRALQIEERLHAGSMWTNDLDLVFTRPSGEPLSARGLREVHKKHLEVAGLRTSRFHDLRHSCASLLLAQGVPARVVMELLGHSNIQVTMNVYSHVMPTLSRQAADSMDAALRA